VVKEKGFFPFFDRGDSRGAKFKECELLSFLTKSGRKREQSIGTEVKN
jgi:hypothetical protein